MKKLLLLFFLFAGLLNAQIVNIPDANFKAKLLDLNFDTNKDGEIQESEALAVIRLNVNSSSISDLTGIEAFVNLRYLYCSENQLAILNITQNVILEELYCDENQLKSLDITKNENLVRLLCRRNQLISIETGENLNLIHFWCDENQLTSIDVTKFSNLLQLICDENQLTSLDVTQNLELQLIKCSDNQLTSIDLSQNENLVNFRCYNNSLTSLDVSQNIKLQQIGFSKTQITSLDVSQNIKLQQIGFSETQITSLDLSKNIKLSYIGVSFNKIKSLDLSQNVNLQSLYCNDNELTELFIKNGVNETVNFTNNPNLTFVCADESQIESLQTIVNENTLISSYCNFTPGGGYNAISGSARFDADLDGCSTEDALKPYLKIDIDNGTTEESAYTNASGNFSFYTNRGSYSLTPVIENPSWFTISPETISANFSDDDGNVLDNQDFCISPNGTHNDLEIVISPIELARPGFDAVYKIVYKNKGNQTLSGTVDVSFDDTVLDYVSASVNPDSQSTGNLSWNYTNLLPFESRSFEVTLNVNSPMETPAVNNDDVLNFTATINPVSGDETTDDNIFQFNQTVVGSYDPNDIICLEGERVLPEHIGEYLHYHINFENTGTAAATFIVVKNIVDITQFDMSTLQILEASHSMETKVEDNKLEFIFDDINLEAEGKGYIVFKIKSLNTLVAGDNVSKKADIFFDYNFPIETNFAITTFENTLSSQVFKKDHSVSVFPNPAKDVVNVNANSLIKAIEIYDIQGRMVLTKLVNEKSHSIDISNFTESIYLLKVKTEEGDRVEKIIIN